MPTEVARESVVAGYGTAVVHGVADLDAGREAVEDEAADLAAQDRDELREIGEVLLGAVDRRGQVPVQRARELEQLGPRARSARPASPARRSRRPAAGCPSHARASVRSRAAGASVSGCAPRAARARAAIETPAMRATSASVAVVGGLDPGVDHRARRRRRRAGRPSALRNALAAGESIDEERGPGFVQNWPAPSVTEAARPFAIASAALGDGARAGGRRDWPSPSRRRPGSARGAAPPRRRACGRPRASP